MNFKTRTLFTRDNLRVLRGMDSECIDLIYLDPPFNSNKKYTGALVEEGRKGDEKLLPFFSDVWELTEVDTAWLNELKKSGNHRCLYEVLEASRYAFDETMQSYLINMAVRLFEMQRILKPTGSIYLHCDPTASHYLKIVMDCVFGHKNFRNEVVWSYRTGGASKRSWAKKHDILLFYSKDDGYTFNRQQEKAYTKAKGRKEGKVVYGMENGKERSSMFYEDEGGVYTLVNMRDMWDMPYINSQAKERTGYPTQKPLALLHRIIKASSNEGDVVLDPFCGCATAMVAAEQLNREWIGVDISPVAIKLVSERMRAETNLFDNYSPNFEYKEPARTDGREVVDVYSTPEGFSCTKSPKYTTQEHMREMFIQQGGRCNGCCHYFDCRHMVVDHITPRSKGGTDDASNLQLLCAPCNGSKSDRTMEQLIATLDANNVRHPDCAESNCTQ